MTQPKSDKAVSRFIKVRKWKDTLILVAGAVLIFGLGYGIGEGNISFGGVKTNPANEALGGLDYNSLDETYNILKRNFDGELTSEQLLDGMKRGMANATKDPYTEFFTADEAKEFEGDLKGSFEGIGAELGKDKNTIIVISPIEGYPAQKAGLRPKDAIIKINGESAVDLSISEAVKKIRGPKDSEVTLTILRDGQQQDIKITRAEISVPSVEYKLEGQVGYIKISRFGDDTVELARKAAEDLLNQGAKAFVLDLRSNPGGYLDGSVDVSSIWLDKGDKVVEEKRGGKILKTQYASGKSILAGKPTVILINEGSASASEIVAGALRDNQSATLVGAKTYGKGSVQQIEKLRGGSALKVTIARWFTPAGVNIDKEGIKPDVEVAYDLGQAASGEDPQKAKALELVRQKIQ